jgi:hypothetical protein
MDSAMIGKIEKAMRYANEPDRISFSELAVTFRGDHDTYEVSYRNGKWHCGCLFFQKRGLCSHTMTLERILRGMMPVEVSSAEPLVATGR